MQLLVVARSRNPWHAAARGRTRASPPPSQKKGKGKENIFIYFLSVFLSLRAQRAARQKARVSTELGPRVCEVGVRRTPTWDLVHRSLVIAFLATLIKLLSSLLHALACAGRVHSLSASERALLQFSFSHPPSPCSTFSFFS